MYRIARLNEDNNDMLYWSEGDGWVTEDEDLPISLYAHFTTAVKQLSQILEEREGSKGTTKFWYTIEKAKTTQRLFWPTDEEYSKLDD